MIRVQIKKLRKIEINLCVICMRPAWNVNEKTHLLTKLKWNANLLVMKWNRKERARKRSPQDVYKFRNFLYGKILFIRLFVFVQRFLLTLCNCFEVFSFFRFCCSFFFTHNWNFVHLSCTPTPFIHFLLLLWFSIRMFNDVECVHHDACQHSMAEISATKMCDSVCVCSISFPRTKALPKCVVEMYFEPYDLIK